MPDTVGYPELNTVKGQVDVVDDSGKPLGNFTVPPQWYELLKKLTGQANSLAIFSQSSSSSANDSSTGTGSAHIVRMVGFTIDGGGSTVPTGVAGAIQVPFAGTIIGWSIEETSGHGGSISINVNRAAGTQTTPTVPSTGTNLISGSSPIKLSLQSANATGTSGVTSWTTGINIWDSILFNVTSATTVQRVTGWILIQT